MKAKFTILKIFYKGTKRRVYNILYISLKLAYSVDIHLLIERDYSLVQAQLASQENQQGSLHSPLLGTITQSKLGHKLINLSKRKLLKDNSGEEKHNTFVGVHKEQWKKQKKDNLPFAHLP